VGMYSSESSRMPSDMAIRTSDTTLYDVCCASAVPRAASPSSVAPIRAAVASRASIDPPSRVGCALALHRIETGKLDGPSGCCENPGQGSVRADSARISAGPFRVARRQREREPGRRCSEKRSRLGLPMRAPGIQRDLFDPAEGLPEGLVYRPGF